MQNKKQIASKIEIRELKNAITIKLIQNLLKRNMVLILLQKKKY